METGPWRNDIEGHGSSWPIEWPLASAGHWPKLRRGSVRSKRTYCLCPKALCWCWRSRQIGWGARCRSTLLSSSVLPLEGPGLSGFSPQAPWSAWIAKPTGIEPTLYYLYIILFIYYLFIFLIISYHSFIYLFIYLFIWSIYLFIYLLLFILFIYLFFSYFIFNNINICLIMFFLVFIYTT